jgi:hypothetical protein
MDTDFPDSDEAVLLGELLGVDDAWRYPLRLWAWGLNQNKVDGRFRLPPARVAAICGWGGDPQQLVDALADPGVRLLVRQEDGRWYMRGWSRNRRFFAERQRLRTRAEAARRRGEEAAEPHEEAEHGGDTYCGDTSGDTAIPTASHTAADESAVPDASSNAAPAAVPAGDTYGGTRSRSRSHKPMTQRASGVPDQAGEQAPTAPEPAVDSAGLVALVRSWGWVLNEPKWHDELAKREPFLLAEVEEARKLALAERGTPNLGLLVIKLVHRRNEPEVRRLARLRAEQMARFPPAPTGPAAEEDPGDEPVGSDGGTGPALVAEALGLRER